MNKLKKGKKSSQVVLSKNLDHIMSMILLLQYEGKQYCAMVDITDVLCDGVEHSKPQSVLKDK
eukprot:8399646-Ditylum_brightwellii.AAC.1